MKEQNPTINYKIILLWFIPLLYLIAGVYFRQLLGNLSLRNMDPDFVYYISGLTISDGMLKVGHIDHPGTPLQLLLAGIFRIIFLFRGNKESFIDDVFMHPNLYISISSTVIIAVTAGMLFYAGRFVYRQTRSVSSSLLIQTIPFLPVIWYDLIARITTEILMPFPITIITLLAIRILYEKEPVSHKKVWLFAVVCAAGLSLKITLFPLMVIPLFLIDTWKKRVLFTGLSIAGFFLFALPVTLQIDRFWGWIKNLFLHSGRYGGGESRIIDWAAMQSNFRQLFLLEKPFFYIFFFLVIILVIYLAVFRKGTDRKLVSLSTGVTATVILLTAMVGKHYAHHYFIPALMLTPLVIFLITQIIKKMLPPKIGRILPGILIFSYLIWFVNYNYKWLTVKTEAIETDVRNRSQTWHFVSTLDKNNSYKIIASQDYGSPFIEYTMTYSLVWAPYEKRLEWAPLLDKLYPYTYNYFSWDNSLRYWVKPFDAGEIINSGRNVYLYLERDDETLYEKTFNKLKEESVTPFSFESKLLYKNPVNSDVLYQVYFYEVVENE
jgi:hypothetical protein